MINIKRILTLIILSLILFMVGNGIIDLTNSDEVFYAQTAKEMVQHNTWTVPYLFGQPQFEKPIFAYWLLRIGIILFGVSNFGAKFFPAIFAVTGVIAVYWVSLLGYKDEKKAFICALVLMSAVLYIGLAKTVFTDMIFSVFILLSLAFFLWGYINPDRRYSCIMFFFIFSGLAVLTKGPLGFFIPFLIILLFLGTRKELKFLFHMYFIWGFLVFLLLSLPWYVFIIKKFGHSFIHEFFYNDHIRRLFEAEHPNNDRWYFYPFSMILCMFPWSIYMVASLFYLFKLVKEKNSQPIYSFMACWICAVVIIFQFAHSKLVSYIFPLFPALAIVTGDFLDTATAMKKLRLIYALDFISWVMLLLLPVGFLVIPLRYSVYLPSKAVVYNFIFLYILLLVIMLFFIINRKFIVNIYLLVFQVFLLLSFALFSHDNSGSYFSSKNACEYLLKEHAIENTILCSEHFARGVRYFTDKEIAIIDIGGNGLFSPHPIPYLNTDEKVKDFLKKQATTYCVLTKSSLTDLQRMVVKEFEIDKFKLDILKIIGNECIVRIRSN